MNQEAYIKDVERQLDTPISRALSLLIRPAFTAPQGKHFVWGDWSAIEARELPWLANSRGSNRVLEVFEGNDNDPGKPDIYIIEAANLRDCDPKGLWVRYLHKDPDAKSARQEGKVPVLSLGFGGSVGALTAMATNYGVYYDEETAKRVVNVWRESNKWATAFWHKLWDSALEAMKNPGTIYEVGRVAYVYDPSYLGGTLFCALPCGRLLSYPHIKWRDTEVENPKTGAVEIKRTLSYKRGFGYVGLWYGKLAENITQAAAASLLREKLVVLDPDKTVVGHTHDEIVTLVDESRVDEYRERLHSVMLDIPKWQTGCPLAAEISDHWFYTKAID